MACFVVQNAYVLYYSANKQVWQVHEGDALDKKNMNDFGERVFTIWRCTWVCVQQDNQINLQCGPHEPD